MALTFIRKRLNNTWMNMAISTIEIAEGVIHMKRQMVNAEMENIGSTIEEKYYEMSEEEFHKPLREMAARAKHLITSHCTDPEWNPPGYVRNLEDAVDITKDPDYMEGKFIGAGLIGDIHNTEYHTLENAIETKEEVARQFEENFLFGRDNGSFNRDYAFTLGMLDAFKEEL